MRPTKKNFLFLFEIYESKVEREHYDLNKHQKIVKSVSNKITTIECGLAVDISNSTITTLEKPDLKIGNEKNVSKKVQVSMLMCRYKRKTEERRVANGKYHENRKKKGIEEQKTDVDLESVVISNVGNDREIQDLEAANQMEVNAKKRLHRSTDKIRFAMGVPLPFVRYYILFYYFIDSIVLFSQYSLRRLEEELTRVSLKMAKQAEGKATVAGNVKCHQTLERQRPRTPLKIVHPMTEMLDEIR
uniref:Uncharacterized protein n=1 Tax=Romanomermis culicivorax TaxID=13658 RepID=A0A915HPC7_ROMCU